MIEPTTIALNITTAGRSSVIQGAQGFRIVVLELVMYNLAAQDIQWFQAQTPLSGLLTGFPANVGFSRTASQFPMWALQNGIGLEITCSVGTLVSGWLSYILAPAQENLMDYIYGARVSLIVGSIAPGDKARLIALLQ